MSDRRTDHASFTIERHYPFPPSAVFLAWSDPIAKRKWFTEGDGFSVEHHALDFRVGGLERLEGAEPSGRSYTNDVIYHDIVEDERIVFSYRMTIDGAPISVSLASIEIMPSNSGVRLKFTEHNIFLDDGDNVDSRKGGWMWLLDRIETALLDHTEKA